MTLEEINLLIKNLVELREKMHAIENKKYYDLDLSDEQVKTLSDRVDELKLEVKKSGSAIQTPDKNPKQP